MHKLKFCRNCVFHIAVAAAIAAPNSIVKVAKTGHFPADGEDLLFGWYFASEQVVGHVDTLPQAATGAPPRYKHDHAVVVTGSEAGGEELSVWKVINQMEMFWLAAICLKNTASYCNN